VLASYADGKLTDEMSGYQGGEMVDLVHVEAFSVSGLKVRTTNACEMDFSASKIGPLWGEFFHNVAPEMAEGAVAYGVYSDYESDTSGEFTVLAGSPHLSKPAGLSHVQVASGSYLKFSKQGEMPQAVIELWSEIWQYFVARKNSRSDDNSTASVSYTRAFNTDFEKYIDGHIVEIYIGVK